MPKRAWGYVFALGLTVVGSLLGAQERPNQDQVEAQATQGDPAPERAVEPPASQIGAQPTQVASPEHAGAAEPDGEPSSDDEPIWPRYGDGLAQWIMAGLSLPAVVLSWYAVVLLKRTLAATLNTVEEAKKGAVAAQEAVAATREIGEAQTRAYLSIERVAMNTTRPHFVFFRIAVKNSGQSPAIGACAALQLAGGLEIDDTEIPPALISTPIELGDIAAGGRVVREIELNHGTFGPYYYLLRGGVLTIPVAYVGVYASDVFKKEIFEYAFFKVAADEATASAWLDAPEGNKILAPFGSSREVTVLYKELREHHQKRRKHLTRHLPPTHAPSHSGVGPLST